MKEQFTLSVKRPREEVFKDLTDIEQFARLSQGKVNVVREGENFRISASVPGMPIQDVVCRTTVWDPPRTCVRVFDVKDLPITLGLTFSEEGTGTKIAVDFELVAQSMMYKMMLPMLERKLKADKDKALAQLQNRLDAAA